MTTHRKQRIAPRTCPFIEGADQEIMDFMPAGFGAFMAARGEDEPGGVSAAAELMLGSMAGDEDEADSDGGGIAP